MATLLGDAASLQAAGDDIAVERLCRLVIAMQPGNADAHFRLGSLLGRQNRADEALLHLSRAVEKNPQWLEAQVALGNVHLLKGRLDAAQDCYAAALRLAPSNPTIFFNLGMLAQSRLDYKTALANFEQAYALAPRMDGLLKNLTWAQVELGQFEVAEQRLQELATLRPDDPEVLFSLGYTLQNAHRPEHAIGYFERARTLGSKDADFLFNFGIVLRDLGRINEAMRCFDDALAAKPNFEPALWHRSLASLLQQDFVRGWAHYDLRLISKDRPQQPQSHPQWRGQKAGGARLLIYGEHGLGDEIMFASCLPEMIAASGRCTVECSPKLQALFQRSFPHAEIRSSAPAAHGDAIDTQVAMGSLPQYLRKTAADFPRHQGYLCADPARVAAWRQRLSALGAGPTIGISWRGGSYKSRSPVRSLPLDAWGPILQLSGAHFVDLQYTDCSDEVNEAAKRFGINIHRWPELREDFEETAAAVCAVDLVISVCTTLIHVSGALGRPVWIMAPFSPEWRYGLRGDGMPWYPSARVFRQPSYGAWAPLIADVAQSLRAWRDDKPDAGHQLSLKRPE